MKDWLRFKVLAPKRLNKFPSFYSSHSQFGEDMVIRSLLHGEQNIFYVDIGAHHPIYYSNTYHFYLQGARGINIDAIPGSMKLFQDLRPRDINLELCLSDQKQSAVRFYMFERPALNTLDHARAKKLQEDGEKLLQAIDLPATTINELLAKHLPAGQKLSLLTIDIEGLDQMVLQSLDFKRYSPQVIVIENHHVDVGALAQNAQYQFLLKQGYQLKGIAGPSFIYQYASR